MNTLDELLECHIECLRQGEEVLKNMDSLISKLRDIIKDIDRISVCQDSQSIEVKKL